MAKLQDRHLGPPHEVCRRQAEPHVRRFERHFDCAKINTCTGTPNPPGLDAALEARIESAVTDYWIFGFRHNHTRSSKLFSGPLLMELQTQLALTAVDPDVYEPKFSSVSTPATTSAR